MKSFLSLLVFVACIGLAGCPMKIREPLDSGSYTDTNWLLGKWKLSTAEVLNGYELSTTDTPGVLNVYRLDTGRIAVTPRKMVLSSVADRIFASIYDIGESPEQTGYFLYQIVKESDDKLVLLPVMEYTAVISTSTSPDSARLWLLRYYDTDIYEHSNEEHYTKQR